MPGQIISKRRVPVLLRRENDGRLIRICSKSASVLPIISVCAVLWMLWATAPVAAQDAAQNDAVELRLSPSPGTTFHLVYDHRTNQVTEVEGKSIEMKYEMGMEMDWIVDTIDDEGVITMTQRFTRFWITMESANVEPIAFDTDDEEEPMGYAGDLFRTLSPLLNADVQIQMNALGEIVHVAVPIETMDAIREVPGSMDIRNLFTDEGITETLSGTLTALPEEAVEPGEQWVSEKVSELTNGRLHQQQTYTYAGRETVDGQELDRIDVAIEFTFEQPEDDVREPQSIKSQTQGGVIWIDPETGMFSGSDFSSELVTETPYRESLIETTASGSFGLEISVVPENQ